MTSKISTQATDVKAIMKDVERKIQQSKKFSWTYYQSKKEPYRHTGIVLLFDQIPCFTIDVRLEDGTKIANAVFWSSKANITIAPVLKQESIECGKPLEKIELEVNERETARKKIRSIIYVDPGEYNVASNNCRHHVEAVVRSIMGKELEDIDKRWNRVAEGDTIKKMMALGSSISSFAIAAIGCIILAAFWYR